MFVKKKNKERKKDMKKKQPTRWTFHGIIYKKIAVHVILSRKWEFVSITVFLHQFELLKLNLIKLNYKINVKETNEVKSKFEFSFASGKGFKIAFGKYGKRSPPFVSGLRVSAAGLRLEIMIFWISKIWKIVKHS